MIRVDCFMLVLLLVLHFRTAVPVLQAIVVARRGAYLNKCSGNSSLACMRTKARLLDASNDSLGILGLHLVQTRKSSGVEFPNVDLGGESNGRGGRKGEGSKNS